MDEFGYCGTSWATTLSAEQKYSEHATEKGGQSEVVTEVNENSVWRKENMIQIFLFGVPPRGNRRDRNEIRI